MHWKISTRKPKVVGRCWNCPSSKSQLGSKSKNTSVLVKRRLLSDCCKLVHVTILSHRYYIPHKCASHRFTNNETSISIVTASTIIGPLGFYMCIYSVYIICNYIHIIHTRCKVAQARKGEKKSRLPWPMAPKQWASHKCSTQGTYSCTDASAGQPRSQPQFQKNYFLLPEGGFRWQSVHGNWVSVRTCLDKTNRC